MGIDLEIELNKLGELPLYPPRRRLVDLIPTFIVSWLRLKYSWPKASPREAWAVSGLMLRVSYQTLRAVSLVYEQATPGEVPLTTSTGDMSDPFRWS